MAVCPHEFLAQCELLACGDSQLQLDEVDTRDRFGDRVLDLQAGVDLEEVDRVDAASLVHEELDRAGPVVPDGLRKSHCAVADRRSRLRCDACRRRLFDDLLIAPLDRALSFTEVDDVAVHVADDLDLHVAGAFDVGLDEDGPVAERRLRLSRSGSDGLLEFLGRSHDAHAPTAATGGSFDERGHRYAVWQCAVGDLEQRRCRHTRFDGELLRCDLVAERPDLIGSRTDPDQSSGCDLFCNVGVLGEEPVAGVDCLAALSERDLDDRIGTQVRLGGRPPAERDGDVDRVDVHRVRIGLGVHPDRRDPQAMSGPSDPNSDLTPVRDQQRSDPPRKRPGWSGERTHDTEAFRRAERGERGSEGAEGLPGAPCNEPISLL